MLQLGMCLSDRTPAQHREPWHRSLAPPNKTSESLVQSTHDLVSTYSLLIACCVLHSSACAVLPCDW